jgi:hypothetical protein
MQFMSLHVALHDCVAWQQPQSCTARSSVASVVPRDAHIVLSGVPLVARP